LAALALLAYASLESVTPLAGAVRQLDASAGAAARLEDVTVRPPSVHDPARPRPLPRGGDLEVGHVRVRFDEGGPWVLDDVSLRLRAGERLAVVGPSGAGKTTLARLLVRFRDPDAGVVSLGGVDLRELAQEDVRHVVRLAGQDAHLFGGSVRANLALAAPEARPADLRAALAAVGLGDGLETLPGGLDTPVGERGAAVSGGQRRRIAAARVLLADARFLVLDEPAAHLDADGRERLLRALVGSAGERGLLVVTHALEGLDAFDEVIVIERGRIVERGPEATLRAAGGRYASLAAADGG
jgi:ABC-type transport system involved in cytochrome bd biosynthesis fused ATPase/permease subunit